MIDRLYNIWQMMKQRCYNPNATRFERYGGRGITVCDEWKGDFQAFKRWAMAHGYEDHLTIERIDNNRGYSPNNCRFITVAEQNQNRLVNHTITFDGVTKTLAQWAKSLGVNKTTLYYRFHAGWTEYEILFGKRKGESL